MSTTKRNIIVCAPARVVTSHTDDIVGCTNLGRRGTDAVGEPKENTEVRQLTYTKVTSAFRTVSSDAVYVIAGMKPIDVVAAETLVREQTKWTHYVGGQR